MNIKVDINMISQRLDKSIRKKFKSLNLNVINSFIKNGRIKVNEKRSRSNYRLREDDIISLDDKLFDELSLKEKIILSETEINLIKNNIVLENQDILIFNKPGNTVMHKGSSHEYGISEMIKSYLNNQDFTFINRIDKDTKGLIIGAKNINSLNILTKLQSNNNIEKFYYILVKGNIEKDFVVENYLKKENNKTVVTNENDKDGKLSKSMFYLVKNAENQSLLIAKLITGRTHQLRAQLSDLGHPIIGDYKYGENSNLPMCLISYRAVIKHFNIDTSIDIPDYMKI